MLGASIPSVPSVISSLNSLSLSFIWSLHYLRWCLPLSPTSSSLECLPQMSSQASCLFFPHMKSLPYPHLYSHCSAIGMGSVTLCSDKCPREIDFPVLFLLLFSCFTPETEAPRHPPRKRQPWRMDCSWRLVTQKLLQKPLCASCFVGWLTRQL